MNDDPLGVPRGILYAIPPSLLLWCLLLIVLEVVLFT